METEVIKEVQVNMPYLVEVNKTIEKEKEVVRVCT